MLKINGENSPQAIGQTVADYLAANNIDARTIAIERNEDILPKEKYDTTTLQDGDVIEIVTFMGGGC